MEKSTRRRFIELTAAAGIFGTAGCTQIIGGQDIKDTDGDGVIDSEDYAPRDPDVQRASQVKQSDPTDTETPDTTETEIETADKTDRETPSDSIVAQDQLISRWPFQSGFQDVVGDNDIRIDRGNPSIGTYDGRTGVALDGSVGMMINEGENQELSILSPDSGASSIGGWIYFDQETGSRDANGEEAIHHVFRNDAEYVLAGVPADGAVELNLRISSQVEGEGYNVGEHTTDETLVPTDEWHHAMYVVDPEQSLTFYLDGEQQFHDGRMNGYSPNAPQYWSHETVGSWYGTNNPTWYDLMVGKLSDFRIYDTGLTAEEISQIYFNTN